MREALLCLRENLERCCRVLEEGRRQYAWVSSTKCGGLGDEASILPFVERGVSSYDFELLSPAPQKTQAMIDFLAAVPILR